MHKITREEFYNFIRKQEDSEEGYTFGTKHFLKYFDKYQSTGKKGNWNWFGFMPLWFFYRRMYSYGAGLLLIDRLLDKVLEKSLQPFNLTEDISILIEAVLTLLSMVICMRYADYIYLYYASDKISKGKKNSGVNQWAVIGFLIFIVGIVLIVKALNRI